MNLGNVVRRLGRDKACCVHLTFSLFWFSAAASLVCSGEGTEELLQNPGFEGTTFKLPAGHPAAGLPMPVGWFMNWTFWGYGEVVKDPVAAHSGKQYLMIQFRPDQKRNVGYQSVNVYSDEVEVTRGKKYLAQVWVKGGKLGQEFAISFLEYTTKPSKFLGAVDVKPASSVALNDQWQFFQGVYEPKSTAVETARFAFGTIEGDMNPLCVDDASLKLWDGRSLPENSSNSNTAPSTGRSLGIPGERIAKPRSSRWTSSKPLASTPAEPNSVSEPRGPTVSQPVSASQDGNRFVSCKPLLPPATEWTFNNYWLQKKVGEKDFYMAEQGPYFRMTKEGIEQLKQVGLLNRIIPGHMNVGKALNNFDPKVTETLSPMMKEMVQAYLKNRWPIHSIQYCTFQGNPPPTKEALDVVGDLWIGDGQPEEAIYRLEPVFHFIETGKKWYGSSMDQWNEQQLINFFQNKLMPRLDKELPFYRDLKHAWTRPELRRLSDLYTEEWFRDIKRPMDWTMFLSPYFIASNPGNVTVGAKGADALSNAFARGIMRQFGNKFYFVWRGHEPTEKYGYFDPAWFNTRGDEWGYPLPHLWYYIYRPYLIGANYYVNECFPPIQDVEEDGQYELLTAGLILKDMLDFADRHPDRGIAYAPVALLLDYNRAMPCAGWGTFGGYNLPFDDADQMNNGVLNDLLFPEHRHTRFAGGYSITTPYGEIFDILSPNLAGKSVNEKALANYKVLFALAGLTVDQDFARKLMDHVRNGGALVINAEDMGQYLPEEFLGAKVLTETFKAKESSCVVCGQKFSEQPFASRIMAPAKGTEAVVTAAGRPIVTRHRYGRGYVILVGAHYMIQDAAEETTESWGGRRWQKKSTLNFVSHFLDHLFTGLTPVEVLRREEDREDLSWIISKKGDGWLVTVFDYSLLREPLVAKSVSTAKVLDEYPLKEIPFQIVAHVPVEDVMEWYGDRDVNWKIKDGKAVISETMHGGEIRVYELQPHKIELPPRSRFVNYALKKPVTASSNLQGYPPGNAVDGDLDNERFWWSDTDAVRHAVFDTPQWLQVDLGEVRTIDHVFVLFHCWKHESLDTRLRIYKYVVEASTDGAAWQKVLDESKSEKNVRLEGLERWFVPTQARYVRLTVLRNSGRAGAQVVEMKVMGPETETYVPKRKSNIPLWEVQYPVAIRDVPSSKLLYLIDLKPIKEPPVGWLPTGTRWADMNGPIKLMTSLSQDGKFYQKAVYAQAYSEIVYQLPQGYKTFAAAIGLGNNSPASSVVFRVVVDGKERYRSPLYRLGEPVLPVVVDVRDAKELKLVVEGGEDGIIDDYAWWGEARLIHE